MAKILYLIIYSIKFGKTLYLSVEGLQKEKDAELFKQK